MPKLNYALLLSNVREAAGELRQLEAALQAPKKPSEVELEHFNAWGEYPVDLPVLKTR